MKETLTYRAKENGFIINLPYGELHVSGDAQYGFRPYQLLVSAVAVCSGGVLRKILRKQRIKIDDIALSAEVTRREEGAQEIEKIHIHFKITGKNLSEQKIEKALALTRKHCSMVQSVKDSIEISETYELIDPEEN
ncbi:osmotically inducible protein C [Caldalkalibacillus thermarum]|uniref:OsmC family protein n=1 Tax=Caldalkalibacillus thermarum TaxID=296745 RepID=UPI00166C2E76|nr:OsmC family protein [Caldalkalibacillus thermarum]GGK14460.1 osmotically inducible protein C [Caldalkalibacillus thermarum]